MRRAKMCPPPQFFLTGTPMSGFLVEILNVTKNLCKNFEALVEKQTP